MRYKSLSYFALVDRVKAPGVAKKIDNTVLAAKNLGLESFCNLYPTTGSGVLCFITSLFKAKSDVIIIRFSDVVFPLLFAVMIIQRIRGRRIIVDIPTPRSILLKELDLAVQNRTKKVLRKAWSYFSGAWVLYPANTVIQYADEGVWFSLGVSRKTLKIGNGTIINEKIPLVARTWPDSKLRLIGVAQLAEWHGYDRLIKAIARLRNIEPRYYVQLTLVGSGDELPNLKALAEELNLQDRVFFTGVLTGSELDQAFDGIHIGVSSLGLYRKGLNEASDLKTREYMARGLPVIGVGKDPDFKEYSPFRYVVENDDSTEGLIKLLYSFRCNELPSSEKIRQFAEETLSLEAKLSRICGIK